MYTFLLVLLIIDAIVLAAAVLLQAGKGGGLAQSFGGTSSSTDAFLGQREAGNLLTKASWWCGGIFIFLAFVLQIMTSRSRVPTSILDQAVTPTTAPATVLRTTVPSAIPLEDAAAPAPTTPAPTTPAKQP